MTQLSNQLPLNKIGRVIGAATLGVGINWLINLIIDKINAQGKEDQISDLRNEVEDLRKSRKITTLVQKTSRWGKFRIENISPDDDLLIELRNMSSLTCQVQKIPNLIVDLQYDDFKTIKNPIVAYQIKKKRQDPYWSPGALVQPGSFILNNAQIKSGQMLSFSKKWLRAGPRKTIYFEPSKVKAAIVTCGGLCPGINTIIKQLVVGLKQNYHVSQVYGIKYSFKGLFSKQLVELDIEQVKIIHHYGGSYLGINRECPNPSSIIQKLKQHNINQLYVIGGDGTLHLVNILYNKIKDQKLDIAVCIVAKSITNDLPIIEKSFGFQTALEETQRAIEAAYVESHSHENGIAIVKVMGKNSGFLAMESCLAARNVHVCLVPQFCFELKGQKGLLKYVAERVQSRGHVLIVVAEGCTESIKDYNVKTIGKQLNGQPIKEDIGLILKHQIKNHMDQLGISFNVKYIDPTYMTRAVSANPYDTKMCCQNAQSAVHGIMAGYTGFVVGHITSRNVMIPLPEMISGNYSNNILRHNPQWQRLLATTGQPSFINNEQKQLKRY